MLTLSELNSQTLKLLKGELHLPINHDGFVEILNPVKPGSFLARIVQTDSLKPMIEIITTQSSLTFPFLAISIVYTSMFCSEEGILKGVTRGKGGSHLLGDDKLPLNSVEGLIGFLVEGKEVGSTVTRKSTYLLGIFVALGICNREPNVYARLIRD
jgi:hypothetical protein